MTEPSHRPASDGDRRALERGRRCELLAAADTGELLAVAEACIEATAPPLALVGPEVGTVAMTVREPVETTRFQLGDVLVTRSEVEHRGVRGWAVRMGDDRPGALAAAICDAEAAAAGPQTSTIDELCRRTQERLVRQRDEEWAQLAPTIVDFEEMD